MRCLGVLLGTVVVAVLVAGCGGSSSRALSEPTPAQEAELARLQKARHERERAGTQTPEEQTEARSHKRAEQLQHRVERELAELEAEEPKPATAPGEVTRAEFGDEWPFTVASGTLSCDGSRGLGSVIFTAPDGTRYGLNGTAQDQLGLPAIDPIWRYQPGMAKYELRVDIGPLIDRGLALCE